MWIWRRRCSVFRALRSAASPPCWAVFLPPPAPPPRSPCAASDQSFNETLFNGRKIASGIGRAFDFSSLGADFVNSDQRDEVAGCGTVLGRHRRDRQHHLSQTLRQALVCRWWARSRASISPEQGNLTPNVSALFSDTFANDTFGVLIDGSLRGQPYPSRNHVNLQGWEGTLINASHAWRCRDLGAPTTNNINAWFIQDYGLYQETTTDTRINGRIAHCSGVPPTIS